ncbi:putative indole-3-acetic acid-amido synthetase GH3.1 [Zea mays]|uniref:Putative indole-3-acetic acid-amido synthetase GH3.1 n=1 Tax=Zea mays TaxID=4577 RepID=A0A1D6NAU5_MAIZE|nr:putative indole-3-acetic acid-amido synthetase GH3.1 [Zea mays]
MAPTTATAAAVGTKATALGVAACERDVEKLEFIEDKTRNFDAEQVRVLAEIRPGGPRRGAPRRRRLRVGPAPRHPLPAAPLAGARARPPDGHPERQGHGAVHPGGRGRGAEARRRPRGLGGGRVRQGELGGHHHPGVAQHQVPGRDRDGRHGAVHPDAQVLQRRAAHGVHHVRVLRVLLRPQPPPHVRPVGGVLHHHAQHGLLRAAAARPGRCAAVQGRPAAAAAGPGGRRGGQGLRAGDHHLRGALPLPRRRHPARHRLPQRGAAVPLRAPQERAPQRRFRQDGRGGAAGRRGARGAPAGALRRGHRRVHEPGGRHHHPGPLRRVLGAHGAGGRGVARRSRLRALLPGDGGGPERGVQAGPQRGRHRAAGDPGGARRHVRGGDGLRHLARRLYQPVQGAEVRVVRTHHRAAQLQGGVQPLQPGVPHVQPAQEVMT